MLNSGLCHSGWPQGKTERKQKKKDKYLDLARELKKKTMEHESDIDTNSNWFAQYSHQKIGTGTEGVGNKRTSGDHSNYSIIKIGQNTKKSLKTCGALLSLRLQWKTHQLTLVWRTPKWVK